jgi:hypothetical protein
MISMARVVVEDALIRVPGVSSSHLFKYVFVSVVFQVSKSHSVALLQVAETTGSRYILKNDPAVIAEHAVR